MPSPSIENVSEELPSSKSDQYLWYCTSFGRSKGTNANLDVDVVTSHGCLGKTTVIQKRDSCSYFSTVQPLGILPTQEDSQPKVPNVIAIVSCISLLGSSLLVVCRERFPWMACRREAIWLSVVLSYLVSFKRKLRRSTPPPTWTITALAM